MGWRPLPRVYPRTRARAGEVTEVDRYVYPATYVLRNHFGITEVQYLKQLAAQAGHVLDLTRLDPVGWMNASKASHAADYSLMAEVIERAILAPGIK